MKKCMLCGKKKKDSKYNFGLSCLKKSCSLVGIKIIKNIKSEKNLNKRVEKLCGKNNLSNNQKEILTEKYLTLKLLEEVPLECYDIYRENIKKDINNIEIFEKNEKSENISLKDAFQVYKIYKKFENIFVKIKNGDYDIEQEITFDVIKFAFSTYYMKKGYIKDMNQILQKGILKVSCLGLLLYKKDFSAMCLEHSLEEQPSDVCIKNGEVIQKVKNDKEFKIKIDEIITNTKGRSIDVEEEIIFNDGDLFASLHRAKLFVKGKKEQNKWNLNIKIEDKYDFTEYIKLKDYFSNSKNRILKFLASAGNNFAVIGTSCKVVTPYMITIEFSIEY